MAQTHLVDERAALDLVAAAVRQARKDIVRRHVASCHRATAWELFLTISELRPYADRPNERVTRGAGTGDDSSGALRVPTGRGAESASDSRATIETGAGGAN